MRTAYAKKPGEDEAWHTVDAGLLGRVRLRFDLSDIVLSCKLAPHLVAIESAVDRRLHQHIAAGEIAAFAKIKLHQPLLHRRRIAARPPDQSMTVERVGLPLDLVARIGEARSGRGIHHALAVGVVALDRAELGDEILLAADAFARNPRIEKVGTKPHLDRNLRLE